MPFRIAQLVCPLFVLVTLIVFENFTLLKEKCKQQSQMMKEVFSPLLKCVTYGGWVFHSTQDHVVSIQTEVHSLNVLRSEKMTVRVRGV